MAPPLRSLVPCCLYLLCGASALFGAAPSIQSVSLSGLQTGGTTTLAVTGSDLLPSPRVLLPIPVAAQAVKPGATAHRVEFDLTLARQVSPGFYLLRVANQSGVSNALVVGVDDLPQLPFAAELAKLPVALHGTLSGSATLTTSFAGTKGQRVAAEVEAHRLGSAIDPLLELRDP